MADARKTLEILISARGPVGSGFTATRSALRGFVGDVTKDVRGAGAMILNLQNAIIAGSAAMAARAIFKPVLELEDVEQQFTAFMGSADKARAKLQQLDEFARQNRLDDLDVKNAYQSMAKLSDGALTSRRTLQQVADAAAYANGNLDEVAQAVGLVYGEMRAGDAGGRGLTQLVRMGLVSKTTAEELAKMAKSGASTRAMWQTLQAELAKVEGSAARVAMGTRAQLRAMGEGWEDLRTRVGMAALPGLKKSLDTLLAEISRLDRDGGLDRFGAQVGEILSGLATNLVRITRFIDAHGTSVKAMLAAYAGLKVVGAADKAIQGWFQTLGAAAAASKDARDATAATGEAIRTTSQTIMLGEQAWLKEIVAKRQSKNEAQTLASQFNSVSKALHAVSLIGQTAFVGWQIGRTIADVSGLDKAIIEFFENRAREKAGTDMQQAAEVWTGKYGSTANTNPKGQTFGQWWNDTRDKDARKRAQAEMLRALDEFFGSIDEAASEADRMQSEQARERTAAQEALAKAEADAFRRAELQQAEDEVRAINEHSAKVTAARDRHAADLQAAEERLAKVREDNARGLPEKRAAARAERDERREASDRRAEVRKLSRWQAQGRRLNLEQNAFLQINNLADEGGLELSRGEARRAARLRRRQLEGRTLTRRDAEFMAEFGAREDLARARIKDQGMVAEQAGVAEKADAAAKERDRIARRQADEQFDEQLAAAMRRAGLGGPAAVGTGGQPQGSPSMPARPAAPSAPEPPPLMNGIDQIGGILRAIAAHTESIDAHIRDALEPN